MPPLPPPPPLPRPPPPPPPSEAELELLSEPPGCVGGGRLALRDFLCFSPLGPFSCGGVAGDLGLLVQYLRPD